MISNPRRSLSICASILTCAACGGEPVGGLELVLVNETSGPLFVQSSSEHPVGTWVSLLDPDGRPARFDAGCDNVCGEEPRVCPAIAVVPSVSAIAPGESVTQSWDGYYFVRSEDDLCLERKPASGEAFSFVFCYGTNKTLSSLSGGERVVMERCETIQATPGTDTSARVAVSSLSEGQSEAGLVTLTLANTSSASVWLQAASACDPLFNWYSIQSNDPSKNLPGGGCTCLCTMLERGIPCGEQCFSADPPFNGFAAPCEPPTTQIVPPGGSETAQFLPRLFVTRDGSGFAGSSCVEEHSGVGETLSATFCYGIETEGAEVFPQIVDPVCESLQFTISANPVDVRLEVD